MSDEAEIAGRLSEDEQFIILWIGRWEQAPLAQLTGERLSSARELCRGLDDAGVTTFPRNAHGNRQRRLTELGLAVRKVLEKSK